jgi:hypothetical protein
MNAIPSSTRWSEIRKGPSVAMVREHADRIVNYRRYRDAMQVSHAR